METLKFSQAEIAQIKKARTLGYKKGWELKSLDSVKRKIKDYKKHFTYELCCYCQKELRAEFNMVIDIEHIIPKSVMPQHMFTLKNLSISCKRCNMQIKKEDVSFLNVDVKNPPRNIFKSKYYKFVHPNIDNVFYHLKRNCRQEGHARIIKYEFPSGNEKGLFTYNYFKLRDLEIEEANKYQGRKKRRIANGEAAVSFLSLKQ
ncbi:HNH endonuclease [Vibrio parahaemolyticus]